MTGLKDLPEYPPVFSLTVIQRHLSVLPGLTVCGEVGVNICWDAII